ncbi:MAG: TRAP transporter large permease [Sphaerochaetaceae bacterium]
MTLIVTLIFLVCLLLGVPVPFSLGIPTLIYFLVNPSSVPVHFMAHSLTNPLFNYVLIALPAFLLSGRMMNGAGITNRIFKLAQAIVGRFKGGLVYTNILASMMFASMSGTAVGDAGGLGQIEIEMMDKAGYKREVSAGITAASSVLGPIIPPSVNMILVGAAAGISVGRMFMGGIIPGIIMAAAIMIYVAIRANFSEEGKSWPIDIVPKKEIGKAFIQGILPMLCPVIIIGGINMGIATPTEAAILAIDYAIILGIFYRELTFKNFWKTLEETVSTAGTFLYITATAGFFTWILTSEGLPQQLEVLLQPIVTFSPTVGLFVIAFFLLIIGCFMDTTAAILMVTPILMPVVQALNIDPVLFGVVLIVSLIIGIITPPFGICLFVIADVANIPVGAVTRESVRYLPAMIVALILIIVFPQMVLWLPNKIF